MIKSVRDFITHFLWQRSRQVPIRVCLELRGECGWDLEPVSWLGYYLLIIVMYLLLAFTLKQLVQILEFRVPGRACVRLYLLPVEREPIPGDWTCVSLLFLSRSTRYYFFLGLSLWIDSYIDVHIQGGGRS